MHHKKFELNLKSTSIRVDKFDDWEGCIICVLPSVNPTSYPGSTQHCPLLHVYYNSTKIPTRHSQFCTVISVNYTICMTPVMYSAGGR